MSEQNPDEPQPQEMIIYWTVSLLFFGEPIGQCVVYENGVVEAEITQPWALQTMFSQFASGTYNGINFEPNHDPSLIQLPKEENPDG